MVTALEIKYLKRAPEMSPFASSIDGFKRLFEGSSQKHMSYGGFRFRYTLLPESASCIR